MLLSSIRRLLQNRKKISRPPFEGTGSLQDLPPQWWHQVAFCWQPPAHTMLIRKRLRWKQAVACMKLEEAAGYCVQLVQARIILPTRICRKART